MSTKEEIKNYISNFQERLKGELPKVNEEIRVYENKLAKGEVSKNPISSPQFNG